MLRIVSALLILALLAVAALAQDPASTPNRPLTSSDQLADRLGAAGLGDEGEDDLVEFATQHELSAGLLRVERVFVDQLTGGETAEQMRDLIMASLHGSGLFVITENPDRADTFLRGAAEDLIFTDQFTAADGIDMRAGGATSTPGDTRGTDRRSFSIGISDDERVDLRERKHEALATVRLVNRDGDVIWSTTQESSGAKFRGASADVASKITRQLVRDYEQLAGKAPAESSVR